jgi:hypothetical protein
MVPVKCVASSAQVRSCGCCGEPTVETVAEISRPEAALWRPRSMAIAIATTAEARSVIFARLIVPILTDIGVEAAPPDL